MTLTVVEIETGLAKIRLAVITPTRQSDKIKSFCYSTRKVAINFLSFIPWCEVSLDKAFKNIEGVQNHFSTQRTKKIKGNEFKRKTTTVK